MGSCTNPTPVWQYTKERGDGTLHPIMFKPPNQVGLENPYKSFPLNCSKCISCRGTLASQWTSRYCNEYSMNEQNTVLTLSYSDENLPKYGSLNPDHTDKFLASIRRELLKKYNIKIKYALIGEYGGLTHRPHYHILIFGWDPTDKEVYQKKTATSSALWLSEFIQKHWPYGLAFIGEFNQGTAQYVADHNSHKIRSELAGIQEDEKNWVKHPITGEAVELYKEFVRRSTRPAIGKSWYDKYGKSDLYNTDSLVRDGIERQIPSYYDKQLRKENPDLYKTIKEKRVANGENKTPETIEQQKNRKLFNEAMLKKNKREKI